MKIKYFRFLYYGRNDCLLHLGEIEDAGRSEGVSFLYVSGKSCVEKNDTGKGNDWTDRRNVSREFSYPEQLDYLIVGEVSDGTKEVVREILNKSEVDTLIVPKTDGEGGSAKTCGIRRLISLADTGQREFRRDVAGWRLQAACLEKGSVVLLHGLADTGARFDDCVMNVSFIDGMRYSGWWKETDGFAAAMRCTVRHDYDVCRYQNAGDHRDYRMETLLYGKTHAGKCLDWIRSFNEDYNLGKRLRFVELPVQGQESLWDGGILEEIPEGHKCYHICAPGTPAEAAVSRICRKNPYQVLSVTGEGTGVSCAGFLKYTD